MTIISNSFAPACRQLLPKYTISTLRSIDIVDNQKDYGRILKLSRFQQAKKERRVNAFPKNTLTLPHYPRPRFLRCGLRHKVMIIFSICKKSIFLTTTKIFLVAMSLQHPRMRQPDAVTFQAPPAPGFPLITARNHHPFLSQFRQTSERNSAKSRHENQPNLGTNPAKPRN